MGLVRRYHEEARTSRPSHLRPVECVVEAGEMVFVPHGWWHAVLNLDDSVAITHNYVR
jgi:oxalate decarboxylase/phosphoglucose isomerase-like protein (cupin superfamily)